MASSTKITLRIMFMDTGSRREEDKAFYRHGIEIRGLRETLQNLLKSDLH
jgi:hypothetical protein